MQIMHRRTRFVIGLVLLVTMGVSVAETVWAAACSPIMSEVGSSAMVAMDDMQDMRGTKAINEMPSTSLPADHDCLPGGADGPSHTEDDGPPCPFSPAGAAQGCTAAASLPASEATVSSPADVAVIVPPSAAVTPHLLQTASIFHPPRP